MGSTPADGEMRRKIMLLTKEQLESAVRGAVRVSVEDGAFRFDRFTEKEAAYYLTTEYRIKVKATAGVHLVFRTNSRLLKMEMVATVASGRVYFQTDILVDGKRIDSFGALENAEGVYQRETALGEGEKTVTVFFPWSFCGRLTYLALEDGASFSPVKADRRFLFYGDSITQGYDALHPSQSYQAKVTLACNANGINKAMGGERFCPRLLEADAGDEADVIFVAYGTNDWNCGEYTCDSFFENAGQFFKKLAEAHPNTPILALTPIWRGESLAEDRFAPFRQVDALIRRAAEPYANIHVIDCFDFVPANPDLYRDRHLHPNDEGFVYYADGVLRELRKYI